MTDLSTSWTFSPEVIARIRRMPTSLPFSPLARLPSSLGAAILVALAQASRERAGRLARSTGPQIQLRAGVRCPAFGIHQGAIEVDQFLWRVAHGVAPVSLAANLQKVARLVIIHVRPKLNHVQP